MVRLVVPVNGATADAEAAAEKTALDFVNRPAGADSVFAGVTAGAK
jgi:hypothetical protein